MRRPTNARNCDTLSWELTQLSVAGIQKSVQSKWAAEDLWPLPPSGYLRNWASMDRLCDRPSGHSLEQLKEVASGSG